MEPLLNSTSSLHDSLSLKLDPLSPKPVEPKYVAVDDVRILPAKLVFDGAFDGKVFSRSFTIINCGKYSAHAFKMKPMPRGYRLSAGMSITRHVSYTHNSAMALPEASFLVYINEKPLVYQIEVNLNFPHVVSSPKVLNFGEIDVRSPSEQKTVRLYNQGSKVSHFSVDLRTSQLDLIVHPMKGSIEPSQTVMISVEVMGSELGDFDNEFWIKTDPPQRVRIKGMLIQPKFSLVYPLKSYKLALVDFPRTYYGAEITKTLIIKNNSSIACMFCVVLDSDKGFDYLEQARFKNDDLKCFHVMPMEGRLQARQMCPIRFKFMPKQAKSFIDRPYKDFALVFLRVAKVHYRDGTIDDEAIKTYQAVSDFAEQESPKASIVSGHPFYLDESAEEDLSVCLYGEIETASVILTPDAFFITYLKAYETYTYEVNIKNMSPLLPITVRYIKIACIDIEPKQVFLEPNHSFEVTLTIKPSRIGPADINVVFELIYEGDNDHGKVGDVILSLHYMAMLECPPIEPKFNLGISPKLTNEVGFLADDVRFNSSVEKPIQAIVDKKFKSFNKNNKDLVAFPNDRPKSLRPWKSDVPCRTIYANIPRYADAQDEYVLSEVQSDVKKYTKRIYTDYIRDMAKKRQQGKLPPEIPLHYDIGDKKLILLEGVNFPDCKTYSAMSQVPDNAYIALTPKKLMGVNVRPKYVELGELAPYTSCRDSFFIENENEFPINVSIKALSKAILIKGNNRLIIKPKITKQIFFDCWCHGVGKYHVPVYIIVNDHHIFDATVSAKVIPTTVLCPVQELVMDMKDKQTCFEIFNPVNCDITFSWEVQERSFEIFPPSGKIPPKKSLYCRVTFHPQDDALHKNEIYLISQSGAKQIIIVACENRKAEIGFHTNKLKFENIPLNIPITKELVLRNFSNMEIGYIISNPNPMVEICVSPTQGTLSPKSDESFEITVTFKDIVEFKCEIEFILQNEYSYLVGVEGNVVYPDVHIQPESIQFRKTTSGAYQRRVFRIRNLSEAKCWISFCLADFAEFLLADIDKNVLDEDVSLEPHEIKELFLEFRPTEPVVYSMFLPYIINGIIGPPALNDPSSVQPSVYFNTTNDSFKTAIELPESLPTVGVRCAAGAPWVEISSFNLEFSSRLDEDSKLWTVRNICPIEHHLAIPLVDPECCFNIDIESGNDVEITNKYYKASLNPGDEVVFLITFRPVEFGSYDLELPIFLDKSIEKCPFNYLKLSGIYFKPTILCRKNIICYQITPLFEQTTTTITLELIAHKKNCMIDVEILHDYLSVKFKDKTETSKGDLEVDVAVTFCAKTECFVVSEIIFKCSCDTYFHLTVKAAASDCKFASYENVIKSKALKTSNEFKSSFPYFPQPTDESFYAVRMRFVVDTFEELLFIQRIFSTQYLKIPHSYSRIPVDIKPIGKNDGGSKFDRAATPVLPLVQILTHLLNPGVAKYFDDGTLAPTFEGVAGAIYIYNTYRNIITFLKHQKVFVPQLEPEYLLPYSLYMLFKENVYDESMDQQDNCSKNVLSQEDFERLSKQCWLDLTLRMYYVFVFDRILMGKPGKSKSSRQSKVNDVYQKEFKKYYTDNKTELEKEGIYESEAKLLLWMEFHYDKQKSFLFDLKVYPQLQEHRKFRNFEEFWDGIAIATVMVAYCPYLKNDLQKFFPTFETKEQVFHNFCLIYEILKKIKLPENLVQPRLEKLGTLNMLMIASYFYDILPGFYPKETIALSAALGDKSVNEITLKNNDQFTIAYTPIFFANDKNDFEVDSDCIIIQSKKQKVLKITYNAKCVLTRRSVLVLSGETEGFKPAKTMAINLVGTPKVFEYSDIYKINIEAYTDVTKTIDVCSPFEKPYQAQLYMYFNQDKIPQDITDFIPVSRQIIRCVPRQFCLDADCTFDDDGFTTLIMTLSYVAVGEFEYFLYFINEDVGDFCVKLHINAKIKKNALVDIDVNLPQYFSTNLRCACNKKNSIICGCRSLNRSCTKLFVVEIPYKNERLFEALRLMFKISTEEKEFKFWNKLLAYPKGFHILRNRLKNAFLQFFLPYTAVLNPTVKYKVEFSKSEVNYPDYITFNNVTSSGLMQIPFHWNRQDEPQEEFLTLYADHTQEIRRFRLNFKPFNPM